MPMKHVLDTSTKTLALTFPGDIVSTNATTLREDVFKILESETIVRSE